MSKYDAVIDGISYKKYRIFYIKIIITSLNWVNL